jgi:riboflavin synthase
MFTGVVEGVGEIVELVRQPEGLRLTVAPPFAVSELVLGESVAVAGACLTVTAVSPRGFQAELSPETLARSTFPLKKAREKVNLERALRLGDRLGGHLVTGHLDGVGVLKERREGPSHLGLKIEIPAPLSRYVIEKGSIAVDGVSLTVNAVAGNTFTVNIIPFTARETTIAGLKVGDRVNLETDLIGKYVARILGPYGNKAGVSLETLAEHGFL